MARKKIGLALSGGGARGYAHVGVLKALEDNSIPIDFIAGTSAGSFVGGAIAAGLTADEIQAIGRHLSWFRIAGLSYSPRALMSNAGIAKLVAQHFPLVAFENLKIPFAAVACDIESGSEVILKDEGDIAAAIRASCAIPGVFTPVMIDGRQLVDGGVVSPVPVGTVREMGADIVIAVDLLACGASFRGTPLTALGMLFQSAMTLLRAASRSQNYHADIVIEPAIAHIRPDEIRKRDELITLGEKAGKAKIEEITNLLRVPQAG
ncbi:MAG: patatin-like phospholipase family protein [Pyrinomonadaceae bacterium]